MQSFEPGAVSTRIDCSGLGCSGQSKNDVRYGLTAPRFESDTAQLRSADLDLRSNDLLSTSNDPRSPSSDPRSTSYDPRSISSAPLFTSYNPRSTSNNPGYRNPLRIGKEPKTTNVGQSCSCFPVKKNLFIRSNCVLTPILICPL